MRLHLYVILQRSAGEKKDSGYLGGAPHNLGVNQGGVLIHNADEQPKGGKRHGKVSLAEVEYSGTDRGRLPAPNSLFQSQWMLPQYLYCREQAVHDLHSVTADFGMQH